jgi:DNA-binding ferritin-like protein
MADLDNKAWLSDLYHYSLLAGSLYALYEIYWECHWTAGDVAFFGDHAFFQEAYELTQSQLDAVMEKFIYRGAYDPNEFLNNVHNNKTFLLYNFKNVKGDVWPYLINHETWFSIMVGRLINNPQARLSEGTKNLLADIIDKRETLVYKMNRRVFKNKTAKSESFNLDYSFFPVIYQEPKSDQYQAYVQFQAIPVHVEYKAGDVRKDHEMLYAYGEIPDTQGVDGDCLDVFIGYNLDSPLVVVIHQNIPDTGEYDEDKVMLGFDTVEHAIDAYLNQYNESFFGGHTVLSTATFWRWVVNIRNQGASLKRS